MKGGLDRRIIDSSFGNNSFVRIGINIRDAKVKAVKGADLDGIEAIIGFNEIVVKGLKFPIIHILP